MPDGAPTPTEPTDRRTRRRHRRREPGPARPAQPRAVERRDDPGRPAGPRGRPVPRGRRFAREQRDRAARGRDGGPPRGPDRPAAGPRRHLAVRVPARCRRPSRSRSMRTTSVIAGPRDFRMPPGLPDDAAVAAARANGTDVRTATVGTNTSGPHPHRGDHRAAGRRSSPSRSSRTGRTEVSGRSRRCSSCCSIGGVVVVLVAFGFGVVYARRALVPIRESLANQRTALRRQRDFAADASHELRTPLTVIRSSVEHLPPPPGRAGRPGRVTRSTTSTTRSVT